MGRACVEVIERLELDAGTLMAEHPPRWTHSHKIAVAARTCPRGAVHAGTLRYSRWRPVDVAAIRLCRGDLPRVEVVRSIMDYRTDDAVTDRQTPVQHWQMNFADGELFFAYGQSLLAQDEWQVLEHPALGALREYLKARGGVTRIVSGPAESSLCTPVLVEGVERRCCFSARVERGGRGVPLYGRRFAAAPVEHIMEALEVLDPPQRSNIVAIAAPACGEGAYTHVQIGNILSGCVAAFGACAAEARAAGATAAINTGFWGCGAFGGNRVMMVALQLLAAAAAGVARVRLFSMDHAGLAEIERAEQLVQDVVPKAEELTGERLVELLTDRGLRWGESDGN